MVGFSNDSAHLDTVGGIAFQLRPLSCSTARQSGKQWDLSPPKVAVVFTFHGASCMQTLCVQGIRPDVPVDSDRTR